LCKGPALFQIGAGAEACVDCAGDDEGAGRALLVDAGRAAEALHGGVLLSIGSVLAADAVNLGAEAGQEALGDCVSGGRAVELEDADVAAVGGGQVCDVDEGRCLG
jgi:hypothetical protein